MTDEMRFLCSDILRYYGEAHQQEKSIEEIVLRKKLPLSKPRTTKSSDR